MKKFEHILVPLDLSDNALPLMKWALELATESGVMLHLLHVVDQPPTLTPAYAEPFMSYGIMYADQMQNGSALLSDMSKFADNAGIRYERTLELGNPAEQILLRANEVNADLIVMATHGRSGVPRFFLGSTTESVIRRAKCPVLTLRTTVLCRPVDADTLVL